MVSEVALAKHRRMATWICASVAASTAAVASSKTTSLLFRSTARAMATICRCPADKFCPPSLISKARRFSKASSGTRSCTQGASWASSRAVQISSAEDSSKGSQL